MHIVVLLVIIILLLLGGGWLLFTIVAGGMAALLAALTAVLWLLKTTWPFLLGLVALFFGLGMAGIFMERGRRRAAERGPAPIASAKREAFEQWLARNREWLSEEKVAAFEAWLKGRK